MTYSKQHIANIAIENESSSPRTLPISIHIDTLGAATIAFGDSMSIRTNEFGLDELRQALFDTSRALMVQRVRQKAAEQEKEALSKIGRREGNGEGREWDEQQFVEQQRRDEKNGLYSNKWDDCN